LHQDAEQVRDLWHEELAHQFSAMDRFETERRILALIPFLIAAVWLPLWLCLAMIAVDSLTEYLGFSTLRRMVRRRESRGYRLVLSSYVMAQLTYMMVPALVWLDGDTYAKSFAVGVYLVNLNHLATIRSVHLPLAMANLVPATLVSVAANTWYWWGLGDWTKLGISTFCIAALTYFVVVTMAAMHELHGDLARDRRAAQVANEAKSRFLAQMSHELRTPLNAIMGLGIAELSQARTQDSRERLGTVVQSARSLSVLLDDILDLSAVEAGALPIRPQPIDLKSEIEATLALFRKQIADAGQELQVTYGPLPPNAALDGQRMRQCLSNVLSNAVKYGGPGALRLQISLSGSDLLVIDLADSGPGVPPALRDQIFEPFRRGDGPMPGTGLGLSISRRLARRMGGDLVLLPSERGAQFRLTLVVRRVAAVAFPPPRDPALADLSGKRILVVDDIATNRLVAVTFLRLMGASALECDSGAAALEVLSREPVDLVLLDMVMPDMDGLDALKAIRALTWGRAAPPVIAMTADATEERRRACLAAGLDGYVVKPLSPEVLSEALAQALGVPRQAAPAPEAPERARAPG
jgi:signal transduction histidine kinase/ActR/RegA family two-component response regulator